VTQFPTPPASATGFTDPPAVQVVLANDTAGAIGATIQTAGPNPTFDSVTVLLGRPALWATGANLAIGGAFAGVQQVALFGPGGWLCTSVAGTATGTSSGAWEGEPARGASGTLANTYPNGPVTSFGAARVDLAPAGTVDALWRLYAGGAPANTAAIPVQTPGNVVYARVAVKSQGLGNGATVALKYSEYDTTGTLLRSGTLQTLTIAGGVQLAWPAAAAWSLSGNWGTGANCAYVDLQVEVADTLAGNSANGTLWLDNAQAWDSTRLGVTTMAYAELRFPQSPAQLVLTGLLGDLPAPALLQLGSYVSAWARGGHLSYGLGRLGGYRPAAILSAASHGFYGAGFVPQATPVLDAAGYGGYYARAQVDTGGWQPRAFSPKVADALGTYHVWTRYCTFDAAPASVLLRVQADETLHPWYADSGTLGSVATYYGPYSTPLAAANQWTAVDAGQLALPPFPSGALSDLSQLYVVGRGQWVGSGAAAEGNASWQCLLPVDGSLLLGTLNFPSNSGVTTMTSAVWVYADGAAGEPGGREQRSLHVLQPGDGRYPRAGARGGWRRHAEHGGGQRQQWRRSVPHARSDAGPDAGAVERGGGEPGARAGDG
jgi:hypothetical protein